MLEGHTGSVVFHSAEVNHICSFDNFIFTAGVDGKILIWKNKTWDLIHSLKAHAGAVKYIAIHKTGKIMFSIGEDKRLYTWNLVEGKPVYKKKFKFRKFLF